MNALTQVLEAGRLPLGIKPLLKIIDRIAVGTLKLTTPEGTTLTFGSGCEPYADIELKSWSALRRIFRHGDIGLAETYRDGQVLTSDLPGLIKLGLDNQDVFDQVIHGFRLYNLFYRLRHTLRRNTRVGSSRNIEAHYDLGNDFYRLWLDEGMTYSSACFDKGYTTKLEAAQDAKYKRIIEMTEARAGDRILEIGCGWGGLAEAAARRGIHVHGLTLSHEQLSYAKDRLLDAGLNHLASFELLDYRDAKGQYDHIVSIEMLEAVGEEYWPVYFEQLNKLLKPDGRAVIQTILINDGCFDRYRKNTDFIQQYIFPGGMLPSMQQLSALCNQFGFEPQSVHTFGRDYAETLRRWRMRFRSKIEQVKSLGFDDSFIRLWTFYLAYCEAGFDARRIDVAQLVLQRSR